MPRSFARRPARRRRSVAVALRERRPPIGGRGRVLEPSLARRRAHRPCCRQIANRVRRLGDEQGQPTKMPPQVTMVVDRSDDGRNGRLASRGIASAARGSETSGARRFRDVPQRGRRLALSGSSMSIRASRAGRHQWGGFSPPPNTAVSRSRKSGRSLRRDESTRPAVHVRDIDINCSTSPASGASKTGLASHAGAVRPEPAYLSSRVRMLGIDPTQGRSAPSPGAAGWPGIRLANWGGVIELAMRTTTP